MATRDQQGRIEYGPIAFLGKDLPKEIYDELADLANWSRLLYIRLRLLEEAIAREGGIDLSASITGAVRSSDEVPSTPSRFVPASEVFGFLPEDETAR